MSKKPKIHVKDIVVLLLAFTVAIVLVSSTVAHVFLGFEDGGRTDEIIAFLLGSIVTIIGEYVLLHLKTKGDDDDNEKQKE